METTKKCFSISTTHGETHCEVYEPVQLPSAQENARPDVVLMIHGCGGSVDHWNDSELPILLAKKGKTVVCYDFYSHGKSVQLSSKTVTHNLALFLSQLNEVIHSPELPIATVDSFTAHGFSMGCYILLQYCVQFKPFKDASGKKPYINKIVLQSPWDGHVPALVRGLIHVPLMLRIFKPWDMAGIKSVSALKQILLGLDEKVDYRASMSTFAQAVSGQLQYEHSSFSKNTKGSTKGSVEVTAKKEADTEEDANLATTASSTDASPTALDVSDLAVELQREGGLHCPVLIITGTRELPFELTGRRIAKYVHRTYTATATPTAASTSSPQAQSLTDSNTDSFDPSSSAQKSGTKLAPKSAPKSASSTPTCSSKKPEYLDENSNVKFRICKYAGHMSFVKKRNGTYVRTFFQREIVAFIAGEETATER